jgi:hypothetical protein
MMLFWTLASVIGVCASAGLPAAPSSTIHHDKKYYNLSTFQNNQEGAFDKYFINMDNAELRKGLSDTMVGAELMRPLFPFPFYGHNVEEFYITTHGFLSLSPRLHDYIYKTQYIAPLRIKLDPSRGNDSTISILSLPERLTIEWNNVHVMETAEHPTGGSFTFQVTLWPNGDIAFVYIEVQPVLTTAALYDHEPVAGISDAFLLHGSELHLYNKINIENVDINTRTVAVFKAKPTCVEQFSCESCATLAETSDFGCMWCPSSSHCSDGSDRLRQRWNDHSCHLENTTTCEAERSGASGGVAADVGGHMEWRHSTEPESVEPEPISGKAVITSGSTVSTVISILLVIVLICILAGFLFVYGRYNESTMVGRYVKSIRSSYEQFGAPKTTTLELGKKKKQAQQQEHEKKNAGREFVNPIPSNINNNNTITANM